MSGAAPSSAAGGRLLILTATVLELAPLQELLQSTPTAAAFDFMLCGVGPADCAATLAARLAEPNGPSYAGVVLGGVGGLYPPTVDSAAGLLDICLAEEEVLADFGIAAPHGADPFVSSDFEAGRRFPLNSSLASQAAAVLSELAIPFHRGIFLTVNAATATLERSLALRDHYRGLCENMEGAAAALVCRRFGLPLLEIRCVSNLVEDRDPARWRLAEAIRRQAEVLARLLPRLRL